MSASTGPVQTVERLGTLPPHPSPPLCAACFHGPSEHSLMGQDTCAGTADSGVLSDGSVWSRRCECIAFRFPPWEAA